MVRTKADSAPGTYRKGEVVEHGSGGQGASALHRPLSQASPAILEAAAWPLTRRKERRGQERVVLLFWISGLFSPSGGVRDCGENAAL